MYDTQSRETLDLPRCCVCRCSRERARDNAGEEKTSPVELSPAGCFHSPFFSSRSTTTTNSSAAAAAFKVGGAAFIRKGSRVRCSSPVRVERDACAQDFGYIVYSESTRVVVRLVFRMLMNGRRPEESVKRNLSIHRARFSESGMI